MYRHSNFLSLTFYCSEVPMTKPTAHREFRNVGGIVYRTVEGKEITESFSMSDKINLIEMSAVQELLDALESIAQTRCSWKLSQEIAKAALTKFREGKAR